MSRTITLMRKKTLLNNKTAWSVVFDGKKYGIIYGGETKKITVDESSHSISIELNDRNIGECDEITIPQGNESYVFQVSLGTTLIGNSFKSCIKLKEL
ncbi:MAG: hypothetical protein LUF33_07540 [Clostridiales bacterium]|nr:hypothetical protein [Clostridiales bacterium]